MVKMLDCEDLISTVAAAKSARRQMLLLKVLKVPYFSCYDKGTCFLLDLSLHKEMSEVTRAAMPK